MEGSDDEKQAVSRPPKVNSKEKRAVTPKQAVTMALRLEPSPVS